MQTFDRADTAGLRYQNLTGSSVGVRVEEEQSKDGKLVTRLNAWNTW